ncbi:MAG: recombinase family protein [Planctomycetaceae bacterium]|nr:recombinase family protein [Planctomycetaceae bacterium]
MRKVFGYVRVSTEQQANEGISLDAQKGKVASWCELNGHVLCGLFVDAGLSGKRADNRPELQKALDAVTRCGGILLVYSLSRLARSTKDTLQISERLEKADADLVSLSEKIDTTSAAGKMVFRMLAVLAEFERDLISERTVAALQHKKRQGGRMGQLPFGFTVGADGDKLVSAELEQKVIQQIHRLRKDGHTLQAIARQLVAERVPNKAGRIRWNTTQIHRLLQRSSPPTRT